VSRIGVANPTSNPEALVDADLDTLATALYVRTGDLLTESPQLAPYRLLSAYLSGHGSVINGNALS
jgi:hypothetical protein